MLHIERILKRREHSFKRFFFLFTRVGKIWRLAVFISLRLWLRRPHISFTDENGKILSSNLISKVRINSKQAERRLYDFQCLHTAAALVDGKSLLWGWAIWAAAVPWQIRFAGERRNQISSCRFAWLDREKERKATFSHSGNCCCVQCRRRCRLACVMWILNFQPFIAG